MKKITLILAMALMGLTSYAQTDVSTMKFGYLSYDSVLQSLSEYAEMQVEMTELRKEYEAEMKRVEDDFNKKYEEFLDGQKDFPKTILQKRQSELQEMLDKNIAFKKESQRMLNDVEAGVMKALRSTLKQALEQVGQKHGYAFILNTDANSLPWLNTEQGEDVTEEVKALLR